MRRTACSLCAPSVAIARRSRAWVRRHQRGTYNLAIRVLYHPQDAEDATQEILIKALTRLSSFERYAEVFRQHPFYDSPDNSYHPEHGREGLAVQTRVPAERTRPCSRLRS